MKPLLLVFALCAVVTMGSSPAVAAPKDVIALMEKLDYADEKPELKGNPVILEFWATWCPPCRTSIPHLNEIYKKHNDKGLEIVGVTNEEESVVDNFTKKIPIDYNIAYDSSGDLADMFKVEGIPYAVLIDKSGKVVWEGHPMELEDKTLAKILK